MLWLYFLLAGGTHIWRSMRTLMIALGICVPAFLWATLMPASSHWLAEKPANVAALSAPGQIADYLLYQALSDDRSRRVQLA